MSKFNENVWVEFPNWENEDSYVFLNNATVDVWAWEALRRNKDYLEDWKALLEVKSQGELWHKSEKAIIFEPAKHEGETEQAWLKRSVVENFKPQKDRLDVYFAKKWGMKVMHDPDTEYQLGVCFLSPDSASPNLISELDEFEDLLDEDEDSGILTVNQRYAVVVYDLTQTVERQIQNGHKIISDKRNRLLASGQIERAGRIAPKIDKWKRHLRVLDALRTHPKPSASKIAKKLGGNGKSNDQLLKEGGKFIDQAKSWGKDHRKILLAGIPQQNTP